jgi:hypothetical protein
MIKQLSIKTGYKVRAILLKPLETKDFSGNYNLSLNNQNYTLEVTGEPGSHKAKVKVNDSTSFDATTTFGKDLITLSFKPAKQSTGSVRLSGWSEGAGWKGKGQLVDGTWVSWTANPHRRCCQSSTNQILAVQIRKKN